MTSYFENLGKREEVERRNLYRTIEQRYGDLDIHSFKCQTCNASIPMAQDRESMEQNDQSMLDKTMDRMKGEDIK
jgi:hypothetical protein